MHRAACLIVALLPGTTLAETYDCVIAPWQSIALAPPTGGVVSSISVEEGDDIDEGHVVARLVSDVEEATLSLYRMQASDTTAIDAERSRLDFLERQLERTQRLAESGIVTAERLGQVETDVVTSQSLLARAELAQRIAEQELVRAEAALRRLELTSPIDGHVAEITFDEGEYVPAEAAIALILSLDDLSVEAFLPAEMWTTVTEGDMIRVTLGAPVFLERDAEIIFVDQIIDSASDTFRIKARLSNTNRSIPAGHRCRFSLAGT